VSIPEQTRPVLMRNEDVRGIIPSDMSNHSINMLTLRRILLLKRQGNSNRQIAVSFEISWQTVNLYIQRITISNRTDRRRSKDLSYRKIVWVSRIHFVPIACGR
jgi:DNA-binding NarL/FixJ family response regulator